MRCPRLKGGLAIKIIIDATSTQKRKKKIDKANKTPHATAYIIAVVTGILSLCFLLNLGAAFCHFVLNVSIPINYGDSGLMSVLLRLLVVAVGVVVGGVLAIRIYRGMPYTADIVYMDAVNSGKLLETSLTPTSDFFSRTAQLSLTCQRNHGVVVQHVFLVRVKKSTHISTPIAFIEGNTVFIPAKPYQ